MAAHDDIGTNWRTAREIASAPDHPVADAIRFCEECGSWRPHVEDADGTLRCLVERGASDADVREAVAAFEEGSR